MPQKAYNLICFNIQKIFLKGNDLYFKEMLHNTVPDTHLLNFYAVIWIFLFRYSAKIVEIDEEEKMVMIHFDGWNQRYDEWIEMGSEKLRPKTRHSTRKGRPKQSVRSGL